MTYEELCNAVLPVYYLVISRHLSFSFGRCSNVLLLFLFLQHWPHLRKHNGERYAYSSHSQAVLDCLRNRHEWARLVDRGPKVFLA